MRTSILFAIFFFCWSLCSPSWLLGQEPNLGLLFQNEKSYPGYTLFAPNSSRNTFLIDNCGYIVHEWEGSGFPELSVYLLEDGSLLKASRGFIEKLNWEGEQVWRFNTESFGDNHHDIEPLPNGNVLVIITEYKSNSSAISRGRIPNALEDEAFGVDAIYEIEPSGPTGGKIVWKWSFWDHLIQEEDPEKPNFGSVADNPQRLDINYNEYGFPFDWLHCNAVEYNAELDQIIISSRHTSELYVVDHSTTIVESQLSEGGRYGKGGDLLWRWGNDAVYNQGTAQDQKLYQHHHPTWIPDGYPDAGKITVFNNLAEFDFDGEEPFSNIHILDTEVNSDGSYSLRQDGTFGPDNFFWTYGDEVLGEPFWSEIESGVQPLPNGNFLATLAVGGKFVEVTRDGEVVWVYQNPVAFFPLEQNSPLEGFLDVFRVERYPADYPAFQGRDLSRKGLLEGVNPVSENCNLVVSSATRIPNLVETIFPNPAREQLTVLLKAGLVDPVISLRALDGRTVAADLEAAQQGQQVTLHVGRLPAGLYLLQVMSREGTRAYPVVLGE